MQYLDAINTCLAGIGEAPLASEEDFGTDVEFAKDAIDRVSLTLQERGWWFNKEPNWRLSCDKDNGFIYAPDKALSIVTDEASRGQMITKRGERFYDMWNHTYDMRGVADSEGYLNLTLIVYLEWDELPPIAQTAIANTARRVFAQDLEVDKDRWQFQTKDEQVTMAILEREDKRQTKRNYFHDNGTAQVLLSEIGGPNRMGGYRRSNFPKRFSW